MPARDEATYPITESTQRRCAGVPRIGREPHFTSITEFARNAARPDGLARVCRECWTLYTSALKAEKAAKPADLPEGSPERAQAISRAVRKGRAEAIREPESYPPMADPNEPLVGGLTGFERGESPSATEARRRFELAIEVAEPDERERLLAARNGEAERLVAGMADRIDALLAKREKARDAKRRQRAAAKAREAGLPTTTAEFTDQVRGILGRP